MIKKTIAIIVLGATVVLMLLSLGTLAVCRDYSKWGTPTYFSIYYSDEEQVSQRAYRTEFEVKNIMLTFVCLSIPIFVAGYLWGKSAERGIARGAEGGGGSESSKTDATD